MNKNDKQIISLAITGASGVQYGFRLLEILLQKNHTVYLMVSKAAQVVIGMETDIALPGRCKDMQNFSKKNISVVHQQPSRNSFMSLVKMSGPRHPRVVQV